MNIDAFFNEARQGKQSGGLYIATTIIVFLAHLIGGILLVAVAYTQKANGHINETQLNSFFSSTDTSILNLPNAIILLLLLSSFVFSMIALWFGIKFFHKRSFKTIITSASEIRWTRVLYGFGFWILLTFIAEAAIYFYAPEAYTFHLEWSKFIPLLLISLIILPIQTSFEELMFRGYLFQGIGRIVKNRWLPILITSILFAAIHMANPEIQEFGMGVMLAYYFSVAVFLAIITVMDEGLEIAMGIHWATNFFGATMVTFKGSALQTDALFKTTSVNAPLMLCIFIFSAIIFLLISKKRFEWAPVTKIFGEIEVPIESESELEIA